MIVQRQHAWTYLLKYKTQSFDIIVAFCNYVLTQFGYSVKQIRSDNALKFEVTSLKVLFCQL